MSENSNGSRRGFVKTAVLAAAAIAANDAGFPAIAKGASPMNLPPLPWADNALEPFISKNTIGFHYGKHHKTYVDNLNGLVAGKPEADMDLVAIVKGAAGKADKTAIFNNAAQVWNHTFYWNSLRPKSDAKMPKEIADKLGASFTGGYEGFKKEFTDAAMGQFGSGWAWLVAEGGKLKVVKTPNAENPLSTAATPLLTLDVWEHAYYLDYQNRRKDYALAVIDNLLNWEFAAKNLSKG
ncbi:MAG TPA: superoxide dismutase [Thermoanaerobaculia bacterium]